MKFSKQQWQWIFYDWVNSGYGILVVTAVLPVYFKAVAGQAGVTAANSTAYWGYANSFGTLIVSILAPLLGALALVPPQAWQWLLFIYILSIIGYSGGNLFYDSFLIDVADDQQMDRVSSTGYGMGYLGGVLAFIIFLVAELTNGFGGRLSSMDVAKLSFILAAVWWIIFGWPLLRHGRQRFHVAAVNRPLIDSFRRISQTMRHINHYRQASWFLVAYFFYIDGVDTIFTMATSIGKDIGVQTPTLMLVLLVVQLIAFPFSILYGYLAHRWSTRTMLLVGIIVYLFICVYAYWLHSVRDYWILAILIGTSQGGIQALSRSYFGRLIPKEASSEFFGFYNILGKFSAIIGPLLVGIVTQVSGQSTVGAASLSILFLVGLLVFAYLPKLSK